MKKRFTILILILLLMIAFTSCANVNTKDTENTEQNIEQPEATAEVEKEEAEEEKPEEAIKETIEITDMANRKHVISTDPKKVFATNPVGTVLIYTLSPQKLAGWNYEFNEYESEFIIDEYKSLPVLGTIKTANAESLIANDIDFIISAASLSENMQKKMDEFQQKLGIPIIMVDESLSKTQEVYEFLGEILNEQDRASELSAYAQSTFDGIKEIDAQKTIYYGNGINSLNTSAIGSPPSQIFDMVGAVNVCEMEGEVQDRIEVSAEHLIEWNPDFIFVNGEPTEGMSASDAANDLYANEKYQSLEAVKQKNIITVPKAPFSWIDRPRSSNRLLGIKWLSSVVYPDQYVFENKDIEEFYKLFYHYEVTDEQIEKLLSE